MKTTNLIKTKYIIELCNIACLERNKYVVVRAHLRSNSISAGLCRNETRRSYRSYVSPYVCNGSFGIWGADIEVCV
ncbi:unnamed protein product [Wuchereria bancrofti]|uniref:Uncharacterized protein n=2 Tax=Wuchereria bancrofti TaxID=6293 RepID=A0A3P7DYU8_WUCBA|nr:unnamed protein product [Wuchereria bancrofti]